MARKADRKTRNASPPHSSAKPTCLMSSGSSGALNEELIVLPLIGMPIEGFSSQWRLSGLTEGYGSNLRRRGNLSCHVGSLYLQPLPEITFLKLRLRAFCRKIHPKK